jgi:hypothetical protein
MNQATNSDDIQQLKVLSIVYYVFAGLLTLVSCCPSIYIGIGIAMASGAMDQPGHVNPPREMGIFVAVFGLAFMAIPLMLAVAMAIAGFKLSRYRSYVYCLVCAAIACILFPLGTAVGVLSLIVLMRPSVKGMFDAALTDGNSGRLE